MKFFLRLFLTLFLFSLVTMASLPVVLSTSWGKNMLLLATNRFTQLQLSLDVLHLSWSQVQQLAGITVKDAQGNLLLSCDEMTTNASLWQILFKKDVGNLKILNVKATVHPKRSLLLPSSQTSVAGFTPSISGEILATPYTHPFSYTGSVALENGEVEFFNPGLSPIRLQDINLQLNLPPKGFFQVHATGKTIQNQVEGEFDIEGSLREGKAHLDHFPTECLDQVVTLFEPRLDGALLEGIGDALNVDLKMSSSSKLLELTLHAESPNFQADFETQTVDDCVSLKTPGQVTFKATPAFASKFMAVPLKEDAQMTLKILDFQLPLSNVQAYSISVTADSSSITLGETTLLPAHLTLWAHNHSATASLLSPQLTIPKMEFSYLNGALTLLKPATFSGLAEGTLSKFQLPQNWENLELDAVVNWKGEIAVHINTLKDAHLQYLFTDLIPLQSAPATLKIALAPPKNLQTVSGTARIETLSLQQTTLHNLKMPFYYEIPTKHLSTQLTATVGEGKMEASADLQDTFLKAEGILKNIPSSLLAPYIKESSLLGKDVSLNFNLSSTPEIQSLKLQAHSNILEVTAAFEHQEATLKLTEPAQISYTLTPHAFASLDAASPFSLKEPATLKLRIEKLDLPTQGSPLPALDFDWAHTSLESSLTLSHLLFSEKQRPNNISLENLHMTLSQPKKGGALSYIFKGNMLPKGDLFLSGSFDPQAHSLTSDLTIHELPTSICDFALHALSNSAFSLTSLLGDHLTANGHAEISNWNGPLTLNLMSPSVQISFEGKLSDGVLTLTEPVYAGLELSQEMSRHLLKEVNPLSISNIRATSPFTLNISNEGFSLPLKNFDLKKIAIPHLRVELGQVYCQNEGNLSTILSLLKLSQFSRGKEIELWFAPIDLQLNSGILTCERTEILVAGAYDICSWGDVNLNTDTMNMVLGLTGSCLQKAFGIKNLPPSYVFQIPMKGPTSDVQIDTTAAAAKLAALMLWQKKALAGGALGGPAGAILGEILDKVGVPPGMEGKTPPAKRPFPWEADTREEKDAAPKKKKKHISLDEKPLKQLFKLLR